MNIKILVCYHKPQPIIANQILQPILLGAKQASSEVKQSLHSLCQKAGAKLLYDDSGEHISHLNPYFCELTAMYWAWKNMQADVYGLFHYRRALDLSGTIKPKKICDVNFMRITPHKMMKKFALTQQNIESRLKNADIISADRIVVGGGWHTSRYLNQYEIYARDHHQKDLDILLEVIREMYPHYEEAIQKVFFTRGQSLSWWNLFIMKKDLYFEYCEFLFSVLFETQKRTDIIFHTPYQQRIYGFMAERLLNVFIVYKVTTSFTRKTTYRAWQFKDNRPWFGWVPDGNIKRFYVGKLRILKKPLYQ
ncbi:DUF4422 domain-containing protein [Helicobacter jaachi]|uniref:DUF4422 domain-containing protein n=1 Tax=Helicobacter jaachi TaxID=1677920 RepID=A0A4U8T8W0_9HELI|nr:DUF4422 domain-containing protein [Helicobacter jaachi]TLD96176.1 DUF4422 domain-containing protein [Helicobacter jaachi]